MSGDEKSTDPGLSVAERKALRAQDFSNLAMSLLGSHYNRPWHCCRNGLECGVTISRDDGHTSSVRHNDMAHRLNLRQRNYYDGRAIASDESQRLCA